ncbi:hypothetical protein [Lacticaseibacillus sharpeae]|uniref:Uncharacterized protein n=1 Tax=Lacticaseibacillus sharpeae JCM 1186 = DSM 20505 TaxID=1291052 RepID=A0A0R1ZNT1_9LACO|nr:hypothetical protein [Lacticaseibacillus sharpeae]KRM54804.1 hypothetical protein FC18_GL002221 [Lacticaseibacillus sharpeae JCM 1186 = DSM 20505]
MTETKQDIFNYLVNRTIAISLQLGMAKPMTEQFERDMRALYDAATDGDPDCPYCHDDDNWIADSDGWKRLYVNPSGAVEMWNFSELIIIHYCPMCGRHLTNFRRE